MWHGTRDKWHMTCDMWHLTGDIWQMVGSEQSLKFSAPQLSWLGSRWINWLINDKDFCRVTPATPGLLKSISDTFALKDTTVDFF